MDPVTAIGVAAAVFQFADVGKRLFSRAREIAASSEGLTATEAEFTQGLAILSRLAERVKTTIHTFGEAVDDADLIELLREVREVPEEFPRLIKSLGLRGSGKASGVQAVASASLVAREAKAAVQRLEGMRDRAISFTLFSLW